MKLYVVVRTYARQITQLSIALISIFSSTHDTNFTTTAFVQNTGAKNTNHDLNVSIHLVRQLLDAQNIDHSIVLREFKLFRKNTWGYAHSDKELDIMSSEPPDYVLFCNGDTYYNSDAFQFLSPLVEQKIDVIGMNWIPSSRHVGKDLQYFKKCEFVHGGVDLNGLLIRYDIIAKSGARFYKQKTPCSEGNAFISNKCRAFDNREYWVADWGFVIQLEKAGATMKCVESRPLFVQN